MTQVKVASFRLPDTVLDAIDSAVERGIASSPSAFVERAVLRELQGIRRKARQSGWVDANGDPLLLQDIAEVEAAFQGADAETARDIR